MPRPRGFTLIELLVVISIIALLASVVLASLNSAREKGRIAGARSFAAQVDRVEGDQTVAAWDFDDCTATGIAATTILDYSGNGNSGTPISSPQWSSDTPSGRGCSMSFDGTSYATVPDAYPTDIGTGSATRAFWFKTSQATRGIMFRKSDGGNSSGMLIDIGSSVPGQVQCNVGLAPGVTLAASGTYNNGVWHHLACVFDRGTNVMTIYIDGRSQGSVDISALVGDFNASSTTFISFVTQGLVGLMDSVHVFPKSLTASEVGRLYADGLSSHRLANNVK